MRKQVFQITALLSRRMIVAVYTTTTLWTPVTPVSRIERLAPLKQDTRRQQKREKSTFSSLFAAAAHIGSEESNGFDSRA